MRFTYQDATITDGCAPISSGTLMIVGAKLETPAAQICQVNDQSVTQCRVTAVWVYKTELVTSSMSTTRSSQLS